jgi:hypothetical protein
LPFDNPRPVTEGDIFELLNRAWEGVEPSP